MKKILALVLSFSLVISMFCGFTTLSYADDTKYNSGNITDEFTITYTAPEKVKTDSATNVDVKLYSSLNINVGTLYWKYNVPEGVTVGACFTLGKYDGSVILSNILQLDGTELKEVALAASNIYFTEKDDENGYLIGTLHFSVDANVDGAQIITLGSINIADATNTEYTDRKTGVVYDLFDDYVITLNCEAPCDHANATSHAAVAATCQAGGNCEYWFCPNCEKYFSDAEFTNEITDTTTPIDKVNGHEWVTSGGGVAATCTQTGIKTSYCAICKQEKSETIPALGHSYGADNVCIVCGEVKAADTIGFVLDNVTRNKESASSLDDPTYTVAANTIEYNKSGMGDNDKAYYVKPGDVLNATVKIETGEAKDKNTTLALQALEADVTVTPTTASVSAVPGSLNDSVTFNNGKLAIPYGGSVQLVDEEKTELARFTITIPENAADGTEYYVTFKDGAYFQYNNNANPTDLTEYGFYVTVHQDHTVTFLNSQTAIEKGYDAVVQQGVYTYGSTTSCAAVEEAYIPEGYRFTSWEGVQPNDLTTIDTFDGETAQATQDLTYKMNISPILHSYTFYDQDGKEIDSASGDNGYIDYVISSAAFDTATTALVTPPGTTFRGWAVGEEPYEIGDEADIINSYTMEAADVAFYPVFDYITYTVHFVENFGDTAGCEGVDDIQVINTSVVTPGDITITRPGFVFDGWYEDEQLTTVAGTSYTNFTADLTLYAKWSHEAYEINFYANANDPNPYDTKTAYSYTPIGALPTDPTKAGKTFKGWVDENGNEVTKDTIFTGDTRVNGTWDTTYGYDCEGYWYAPTNYWLLRVNAISGAGVYKYDGTVMYSTDKSDYVDNNECNIAFIYLIPRTVTKEAALDKLTFEAGSNSATAVEYNGDVNNDDKVNFADVNDIYQMIIHTGNEYGTDLKNVDEDTELNMLERFEADTYTGTAKSSWRSSMEDVQKAYYWYLQVNKNN